MFDDAACVQPMMRPIFSPVVGEIYQKTRAALNIQKLFSAVAGRVGCYYGTKAGPSYTDILARNREALGPNAISGVWTPGSGTTVSGNTLACDATVVGTIATNNNAQIVAGKVYLVDFTISTVVAPGGGMSPSSTLFAGTSAVGSVGRYVYVLTSQTSGAFTLTKRGFSNFSGTITVNEVREIVDWSKLVLFDDPNGTVPVFSVFQSSRGRGLLLDASQGLVRGAEALTNGDFASGATGWTVTGNDATHIATFAGGTLRYQSDTTSPTLLITQTGALVSGKVYEIVTSVSAYTSGSMKSDSFNGVILASRVGENRVIATATTTVFGITRSTANVDMTIDSISVRELPGNHMVQPTAAARGELSARYNQWTGTDVLATQSITAIATQYRMSFSGTGSITLSGVATGTYTAGSHTITCTAGTLTATVTGSVLNGDLRFEADAISDIPSYQRVTSATDYDDVGFPVYWRGQTDDWAKTRINPNGATKVLVMLAGQKMSDSSEMILLETSVSPPLTNGVIQMHIGGGSGMESYTLRSRGTSNAYAVLLKSAAPSTVAPHRAALVGEGDIANDVSRLVVNKTTVNSSVDQGTGAYTEQDVYFGARAGTSLFANTREFAPPLILFMQPADPGLSASQVSALNKAFAKAVGVSL